MLYHPPPATHAVYLDKSPTGAPRIAVTRARKGKRVFTLIGTDRDVAYAALSDILYAHNGQRLRTVADDLPAGSTTPSTNTAPTGCCWPCTPSRTPKTSNAASYRPTLPPGCTTAKPAGGTPCTLTATGRAK